MQPPDYSGTKDTHINLGFKGEDGEYFFVRSVGNDATPYEFGRARQALRSSLNNFQYSRMVLLRLKVLDRIAKNHLPTEDPDGL